MPLPRPDAGRWPITRAVSGDREHPAPSIHRRGSHARLQSPLRDTRFLLNEVFDFPEHYRNLVNGAEATPDMVDAILGECAKLCEEVIAPLYHSGDEEGCHLENGEVRTPKGYKEAYEAYVAGGWQGLSHPVEYGGQGLPMSLGALKQEMMGTANWPFSMYPGLSSAR